MLNANDLLGKSTSLVLSVDNGVVLKMTSEIKNGGRAGIVPYTSFEILIGNRVVASEFSLEKAVSQFNTIAKS